ncbi:MULTISPECIES: FUSC family protein [Marinobacter]|uniref:FUSC family protein n=1 Tax=Marinobacter TaxID=2742 RepID=UPI00261E56A7|nr:FUSC family protein [Marinobacter sp. F26243]
MASLALPQLATQLFTPNRHAVIFALKGVISMALALFVSMYLQLDRPYWAVVSAVFLQIRPESGLVIEKALCQISGSVVGGGAGILILALFMPYPLLALACLTLWIGLNSAASSMVHNANFIYAFAMSGMTAGLVVIMVVADPNANDGRAVFDIAQSRISEISVGALCAMLVSRLLWPVTVKESLRDHARNVINKTLEYLSLELDPNSTHEQRHQHADQILETLIVLNDDSSAVAYEGPEGPGRSRAAHLLVNKVMSLLAVTQIMGRFPRNHPELVSPAFGVLLKDMRMLFIAIAEAPSYEESYNQAQELRRALLEHKAAYVNESAIVIRLTQTAVELVADLVMVLRAYNALENRDQTLLKASKLKTHRDPLIGVVNGFRTAVVFAVGAGVWMSTGSPAAIMLMIMPVVFSIVFARFSLAVLINMLRRLLLSVVVAIPVALIYGLGLLAKSSGDFEILVLVLAGPFFIGLLALAERPTLPYGLGICIPLTLIVQPGNHMAFNADTATSNALGLFVGISILYWVFKLITPLDGQFMQRRLLKATARDLTSIDYQRRPENWLNGRMGERLLRLANYDQGSGNPNRHMTDLGFTGLNIGHMSIRLRRRIENHRSAEVDAKLAEWQQVLADTYLVSSRGKKNPRFREVSAELLTAIHAAREPDAQTATVEGMFERIALTFERTAKGIAETKSQSI